jgi:histidinol-phosphatase (PHP family)
VLTATAKSIRSWPFDFVIASTHFLADLDGLCLEAVMRIEKKRLQALYLGHTIRCVERFDDFDVVGHLTYYSRYATGASKAAREMAYEDNKALYDQLFALLIARGKGLEINTSVKGTKDLFVPDYSIAKRFHRMGGRVVTIGSDAHVPQQVGTCVDQAIEMLREAGFTAICRFDRRMPVFTDI